MHQGTTEKLTAVTQVGAEGPLAVGAGSHPRHLPDRACLGAVHFCLQTYLSYVLIPIPKAQQQMGQHMDHIGLEELPQHGAEHLEGKQSS